MTSKIVNWNDKESSAIGWIVMENIINGSAGGGIFMTPEATLQETKDLARTMKYKNSLQTPLHGGAKAGIKFDPSDKHAPEVLKRFLLDNLELIKTTWVTAADLNTDNHFIHSVLNEAGIGSGFFSLGNTIAKLEGIENQAYNLINKISYKVDDFAKLSECATGYGVACSIKWLNKSSSPRIIIQGFGAVGSSLAYFINKQGIGKVVGIIERDCYIYSDQGIDLTKLFNASCNDSSQAGTHSNLYNILQKNILPDHIVNFVKTKIDEEEYFCNFLALQTADIVVPCAKRYSITSKVLGVLKDLTFSVTNSSVQTNWIICGANNAFAEENLIEQALKEHIYTIPAWVSNSGNATLFVESLKVDKIPDAFTWTQTILEKIQDKVDSFLVCSMEHCDNNKNLLYTSCYLVAERYINNYRSLNESTL